MTKARTPLSFAQAITRIAGQLGWDVCAAIAIRSERTVRLWSEPDQGGAPTLAQALALDAAYVAAGGEGAPLLDSYQMQLGVRVAAATACQQALASDVAVAARECSEAFSTSVAIILPGASAREVHRAIAETEGGVSALVALARRLRSFLPSCAGQAAGNDGGAR